MTLPVFVSAFMLTMAGVATANASERVVRTLPVEVIVQPSGDVTLVETAITPLTIDEAVAAVQEFVPVVSVSSTGDRSEGVLCRNETPLYKSRPTRKYPGFVKLMPDGSWRVEQVRYSLECGGLAAYSSVLIPGSKDARVVVARDAEGLFLSRIRPHVRDPNLTWTYDHANAPAGVTEPDVRQALQLAINRYKFTLRLESFDTTIEFKWAPLSALAVTHTLSIERPWGGLTGVRQHMLDGMGGDDFDPWEEALVETATGGSTIGYRYGALGSTPQNQNTTNVNVPLPLMIDWYGTSPADPIVIEISNVLPMGATWDFYPTRSRAGIFTSSSPIDFDEYDFQGAMLHELGHAFGFFSMTEAESGNDPQNSVSNWDVFRFPASAVDPGSPLGAAISSAENITSRRELVLGGAAYAPTALLDATRTFQLSDGSVSQPSHWAPRLEPATGHIAYTYIGIMNPTFEPGYLAMDQNGAYLRNSDIRAFDLIGYDINEDFLDPPPQAAPLMAPAPGAIVRPKAQSLEWTDGFYATGYEIIVDDLGIAPAGTRSNVFIAEDVTALSISLPATALQPQHSYEWFVVSHNPIGFMISGGNFTVACFADLDGGSSSGIPDGAVTIDDLLFFLVGFEAGDGTVDLDDGTNTGVQDGAVTIDDLLFFLVRFEAGC